MIGPLLGALLLLPSASAAEVGVHLAASQTMNDPFSRNRALTLGVEVAPVQGLVLGARASGYPALTTSLTRLSTQLRDDWNISADLSPMRARADLDVEWAPLRGAAAPPRGDRFWSVGARLSGGVVYTIDDLTVLFAEGDPVATATEHQVHPTAGAALVARVGGPHWELVTALERLHYTEVVMSTEIESKRPVSLGLGASRWF